MSVDGTGLDAFGADVVSSEATMDDSGGTFYAAVFLGLLALPFLTVLPLLPGWVRERRAIGRLRIGEVEQPEYKFLSKKGRTTKRDLLRRYDEAAIDSARRVIVARRKDEEAQRIARNVWALEMAEIRRFAKKKAVADKRAATIAAKTAKRAT